MLRFFFLEEIFHACRLKPLFQISQVLTTLRCEKTTSRISQFFCYDYQRWSRGHKARGQGQGQPFRGQNLSRPRTEMLEAKDQGHSRNPSPKKKVFKNIFQAIFNSLAYPKFLIKEGLNHKSHDMTSSKFFQRGSFCGTKIL